ncbi:MAG: YihY/virulence factor BrkB family protein [Actinomycetota bacterium]|nr:YihY/virulence factor BrkB family protein [Actinomycetota bacterium]
MSGSGERKTGVFGVVKRSVKEFSADDMLTYAAAVSYQVFFSLFPFLIFLLALLGLLNIPGFFDWLLGQADTVLPQQAAGLVRDIIGQVRSQASGGVFSFGAIIALYSASSAVRMAMHALNVAYDVEEERPAWKKFPLSLLYTLLLAALAIAAVGLILLGGRAAEWFAGLVGFGSLFVTLWTWLRIPVAILLLTLILALVYYLFPNTKQPLRIITPGAVIAILVWLAASLGFSFYVQNFGSYSATYGALAAVIVLLFYFFISAAVLLFGAEINSEVYREVAEDGDGGGDGEKQSG